MSSNHRIVCYYGSWSVYRPDAGKFDVSFIDPHLCTHLVYTFVGIQEDGEVHILDPWNDLPDNGGKDGFRKFNDLKKDNPALKTMVAIGGWNEGSSKYSHVAKSEALREKFADNAVAFVKKYGFDGFDMDWEYPCQRGGCSDDKKNFVLLLRALRRRFSQENLILSAAVASAEFSAEKSYEIEQVVKELDFVNVMCYDLHGAWDKKTGINAPLYAGSWENESEKKLNVDACIDYWLSQGAPAAKINLGVPFYGRGFTLADSQVNGIGATAWSPSNAGPYTREAGMLGYNEILEKLKSGDWSVHRSDEQRVPYAVSGNQWVGYDDEQSLQEKAEYIKKRALGGVMIWSIETDDFRGTCGDKFPLLSTFNKHLLKDETNVGYCNVV
ncbi:acidic mammalian chitinase-like [Trichogramma pretiosum]|uniref:acidic mammalian chitinase-like n=1 Tax=Trichogramma pretiosum TaxID=7493 RepID=UPI0006C94370|nr:acidic mammalian chitinase-like [Trichogramma pretiosum]